MNGQKELVVMTNQSEGCCAVSQTEEPDIYYISVCWKCIQQSDVEKISQL